MSDQEILKFEQLKNSDLPYSYNVNPFARANGLTVNTMQAGILDPSGSSIILLFDQNQQNGVWSGIISGLAPGTATVTLTTTFANSNVVRKRKFQVTVVEDPI